MLLIYMVCLVSFLSLKLRKKTDAYLFSIVIWMLTVYLSNEILSVNNNLNRMNLMIFYILLCLVMTAAIVYYMKKKKVKISLNGIEKLQAQISENKAVISFAILFLLVLLMGFVTIPHTVDSMTYGMTRIAYWHRNQSVAHFATNDVRAVTSPPLAEFINLQIYILSGQKDRLFTMLQTTSFITNALLIAGICKKLRVEKKYIYLSVFLFVSMPIAFSEAFTTQVEQFATLWLLLFVYFILDFIKEDFYFKLSVEIVGKAMVLGACIVFGYLSKPSVMFGMLIFALWLLLSCIKKKEKIIPIMVTLIFTATEMIILVAPELARNYMTFHAFSASSVGAKHMIDTFNPIYVILNFMKNVSINLPNVYLPWIAEVYKKGMYFIAYKIGVDLNDPAIAHDGVEYIMREPGWYACDSAVNPVIFYLTVIVCIWLIVKLIRREEGCLLDTFSYASIISWLFFCFTLKYELYGVRYMLSYLALLCPMVGGQLAAIKKRFAKAEVPAIAIIIFVSAIELIGLFIFNGERTIRHIFAKDEIVGYFEMRENDESRYREVADYLNAEEYDNLGVYFGWTAGEYPLWKMIDEDVRIDAVNVTNETAVYADDSFVPDYIMVKNADPADIERYGGNEYLLVKNIDDLIYLYVRK